MDLDLTSGREDVPLRTEENIRGPGRWRVLLEIGLFGNPVVCSEDDNLIVNGVQAEEGGLGYFGYAYYEENKDSLKSAEVQNEAGDCVAPTRETIADGSYNPMSRPLFFYVKADSYENEPEVKAFVDYMIDPANSALIGDVGYVPLPADAVTASQARLSEKKIGKDPT